MPLDGAREDLSHGAIERQRLRVRDAPGFGERMEARIEQSLVGVNISQPGERLLVHQPALESAAAAAHGGEKFVNGCALGVRPELGEEFVEFFARQTAQVAKASDVAKPQFLLTPDEGYADVRVRLERRLAPLNGELARHSEPHHQVAGRFAISGELDEQHLSLALDRLDPPAAETLGKCVRRSHNHGGMANFHALETLAEGVLSQPARDRFDFGKFGHGKSRSQKREVRSQKKSDTSEFGRLPSF